MKPIDALMAGFISLLSGTLVILWLQDAERLRLACGIVLICYLVAVIVATYVLSPRRRRAFAWVRSVRRVETPRENARIDIRN